MSASNNSNPDLATLQADLAALKRDVGDLISHLKASATSTAQGAAASLEDGAGRLFKNLSAEGERSMQAVCKQIEAQPVVALLIAFGVGYLGGRLLTR